MLPDGKGPVLRTGIREVQMQLRQVARVLAGALVLAGVMAADANAQRRGRIDPEWVLLGEKSVGFRVDRDVINIGQGEDWYRDRRFRQLRFVADRNDVHMMSIRLVYFNGFAEDFRVDRLIRDGEDLPIDLRGDRSFIRRIEMVYRSRPSFGGEAVIKVYGEPARRGPPPGPPPGPMPGPGAALGRARLPAGLPLRQGPRLGAHRSPRGPLQGDPAARPRRRRGDC